MLTRFREVAPPSFHNPTEFSYAYIWLIRQLTGHSLSYVGWISSSYVWTQHVIKWTAQSAISSVWHSTGNVKLATNVHYNDVIYCMRDETISELHNRYCWLRQCQVGLLLSTGLRGWSNWYTNQSLWTACHGYVLLSRELDIHQCNSYCSLKSLF